MSTDLLTPADIERMRRNATESQYARGIVHWTVVTFADGPLAGMRIRVPAADAHSAFLGFAVLTERGVVQVMYREHGRVRVLDEIRPGW